MNLRLLVELMLGVPMWGACGVPLCQCGVPMWVPMWGANNVGCQCGCQCGVPMWGANVPSLAAPERNAAFVAAHALTLGPLCEQRLRCLRGPTHSLLASRLLA